MVLWDVIEWIGQAAGAGVTEWIAWKLGVGKGTGRHSVEQWRVAWSSDVIVIERNNQKDGKER